VLNGSIALITYQAQMTTFNISILSELTVKESWTKLFIVGPLSCVERPFGVGKDKIFFAKKDLSCVERPFGVGKDKIFFGQKDLSCVERPFGVGKDKIFFGQKDEELAWFDLSTQMIEELDVKRDSRFCRIVVYK